MNIPPFVLCTVKLFLLRHHSYSLTSLLPVLYHLLAAQAHSRSLFADSLVLLIQDSWLNSKTYNYIIIESKFNFKFNFLFY